MIEVSKSRLLAVIWVAATILLTATMASQAQQVDAASVIAKVDAAVKARVEGIASYTVTEHYAVFRGKDEANPVAEMTVKTEYRQPTGKSYTILSQSGSGFIVKHVLGAILDREKEVNRPGIREHAWLNSTNYQMKLKTGSIEKQGGRDCVALEIAPRQKSPNLIEGTIWVDVNDGTIVRLEGTTLQSASILTGASRLMRQYVNLKGFGMATHAQAVTDSFLLGRTVITIDYRDYKIQTARGK